MTLHIKTGKGMYLFSGKVCFCVFVLKKIASGHTLIVPKYNIVLYYYFSLVFLFHPPHRATLQ